MLELSNRNHQYFMDCENKIKRIDMPFAIAIIMANMIGIGVYTSLGYQLVDVKSASAILLLWIIGGITSLCGALVYAELALRYPGSGGEYNYISKVFGAPLGFIAGWVTIIIAFPAPISAISIAFVKYLSAFNPDINLTLYACLLVLLICAINLMGLFCVGIFQKIFMYISATLVIGFIVFGITYADHSHFVITFNSIDLANVFKPSYAVCLVYVAYAYTGWNAVTYVAGEVNNPKKIIPKSLVWATLFVTVIYVLLNLLFMYAVPMNELVGKIEVAQIVANRLFGPVGLKIVSILIGVGLLASTNSMMVSGSYVTKQIFVDFNVFRRLHVSTKTGAPLFPILIQTSIAIIMILTASFQQILIYMGFALTLINVLTVFAIFFARHRQKNKNPGYKIPLYPLPPLVFIVLQAWMLYYVFKSNTMESIIGLLIMLLGLGVYFFLTKGYYKRK